MKKKNGDGDEIQDRDALMILGEQPALEAVAGVQVILLGLDRGGYSYG